MRGIRVDSVAAEWINWTPDPPDAFRRSNSDGEVRIHWGVQVDNGQSGYGFVPLAPPIRYIKQGQRFQLGRFRHYNQPITGSSPLISAQLHLTFTINQTLVEDTTIVFLHDETVNSTGDAWKDRDFVSIQGGFPKLLTLGDIRIRVLGFQAEGGSLSNVYESKERSTNTAYLIAELIDSGHREPECTEGVFNPEGCEVPCVPPIDDTPAIIDCEVPGVPLSANDCVGADIPGVAAIASSALGSTVGPTGPEGPAGPGSLIGSMTQEIEADNWGDGRGSQSFIVHFEETNEYYIHNVVQIFVPTSGDHGYCWWIWTPCDDDESPTTYAVDENCPKSDTTASSPGYWRLDTRMSTGICEIPPPSIGTFYGQVQITTWYPTATGSVGALNFEFHALGVDGTPDPTVDISFTGTCAAFNGVTGTLVQSGDNWLGELTNVDGETYDLLFTQYGDFEGLSNQWLLVVRQRLVGDEVDGLTTRCAFGHLNGPASSGPFVWTGTIRNPYNCCSSGSDTLTVTISD